MAGIGFEIRKLMDRDTFEGDFKAYFFAGVVSSGPWIVSIFGVGFLWMLSSSYFGMEFQKLFRVVVVYSYAYSLIMTGFIQFILTRFLSDKLFLKERSIFLPTYIGVIITTALVQGLSAAIFYSFCDVDLNFKLVGIMLFIAVSCIWQTMIFLSASRDFLAIFYAFFWGNIIGIILAILFGQHYGFNGHLLGFTIGQVAIFFMLMYRIFYEFDSVLPVSFEFMIYFKRYFKLFLIGICYYIAIWIDKVIYWYLPTGEHIKTLFYSHYPYDSCMFLAYLTIIPALAHFMVDVETNFYEAYKGFYGAIVHKGPYSDINARRKEMLKVMRESAGRMLMLQIVVTGCYIYFTGHTIEFLQLASHYRGVYIAAGIGAFGHVFVLLSLIMILYFDRRGTALFVSVFFLVSNTVLTWIVANHYPEYMGWGYATAALITAVLGGALLYHQAKNIEFLTFTEQSLRQPKLSKVPIEESKGLTGE